MSTKIAIILLNYNGLQNTLDCLGSLAHVNTKGLDVQLIVVDYSRDSQESTLIAQAFTGVTVLHREQNLGFAGGNNVGIKSALDWGAAYVMLLNNDTIVSSDFLKPLIDYLATHPQVGCVSPKIYFAKGYEYHKDRYKKLELGNVIWFAGGLIDWENVYASHRGVDEIDHGQYDALANTDFVTGCCVLVNRSTLEAVGWLDEKLFLYWEDTDFSLRVTQAGWQLGFVPQSWLWHKNAGNSGVGSGLQNYFSSRNRLWFGYRYASWRTKLALLRQSLLQWVMRNTDPWIKKGILDYYLGKMGQGSWR